MKRIVLTGGGTAGHVTPHLSLIPRLREAGYEIHYIGTADGIERGMIAALDGVTYHSVKSGKLRRYFSLRNFTDPFRVLNGALASFRLIGKLHPNVVFSKGGFVSVPVVVGAWARHVPVVCHESDITPGLANRICTRFAQSVATTFPECARDLGRKAQATGTPLRPALFAGSRARGLAAAGFTGEKPVLLMLGGSLGAQSVNACLRKALPLLLPTFDVLHGCGRGNLDESLRNTAGYRQVEFFTDDLPDALAAADVILSRAGANAICEFQALKKPMLLVPYPLGAGRGDQILNAESFKQRGLAHVLLQEDMNERTLADAVTRLYAERGALRAALENAPASDGTDAVLRMIEDAAKPEKIEKNAKK